MPDPGQANKAASRNSEQETPCPDDSAICHWELLEQRDSASPEREITSTDSIIQMVSLPHF